MNYEDRLEPSSNEIMYGNILIKGTKVSVSSILRELSKGNSVDEILKNRKEISSSDIYACLEYSAELVSAISFKKATNAIGINIMKRKALANKIRALKDKPFLFTDENGNVTDLSKL